MVHLLRRYYRVVKKKQLEVHMCKRLRRFCIALLVAAFCVGGIPARFEVKGASANVPEYRVPDYVEMLHWRYVRNLITLREPFRVTDINTGIYFYVLSMSNGNHADVETVTARDTELLFQAAGGRSWTGRPVWVTIGYRTFSAAIHSMPHAQSTVRYNNMNGHICLHFYGSTTHNSRRAVYHNVILEAQRAFDSVRYLREQTVLATPSDVTVYVDGAAVHLMAYNIDGHNFFRLRDLAFVLNGSQSQFNLFWHDVHQAILIIRGVPYHAVGNEMIMINTGPIRATPTSATIFLDTTEINPRAYTIAGTNYFMLAELAGLLGFRAEWDGVARAIRISTAR